ncbi:OmpW/AlkL family protein [Acinetobacter sp. WCHAc010052]|uniref:OmpW/AlkL family protein n=1 Tax=Acinetobacter sp. WCHAc010052 TaxID=2004647 RepID=UPI000B3D46E4|nr:OmpW family outer membrane protein [Acinetobacter sp. WCHAc010052]AXY61791.1 OmpW family protein [Acinetobacter sp. WCHAc010052]
MNKTLMCIATSSLMSLPALSHADSPYFSLKDGDGFKRFSVSVGALYVKPTGKAQPFQINTSVAEGEKTKVGDVKVDSVMDAIDESQPNATLKKGLLKTAVALDSITNLISYTENGDKYLKGSVAGDATINGLSSWEAEGTGLEADDVATLGIMSNYFFTDNISFEVKAGLPPKVDIKGKGQIYAPLTGTATPQGIGSIIGDLPLKKDIAITDLNAHDTAATARAWTPAFEFQYHFGKTGVNKFRPYVGVGLMYAYFNELEINKGIESDLINAGHMLINMKENKAGAALDGKPSSGNPKVMLEADDAFAPVVTAGFTYDFNDRWFAVGSVSYTQLSADATINISDEKHGKLINAKTEIEINPILAYAGIGMRF